MFEPHFFEHNGNIYLRLNSKEAILFNELRDILKATADHIIQDIRTAASNKIKQCTTTHQESIYENVK